MTDNTQNGGHCQPNVYAQAPAVSRFELATYNYLRDLIASREIPCDWVPLEGVHAYETKDLFALAVAHLENRKQTDPDLGAAAGLAVTPKALAARHVPSAVGAVTQTHAASVWPASAAHFFPSMNTDPEEATDSNHLV
jgi:hypothetical protein